MHGRGLWTADSLELQIAANSWPLPKACEKIKASNQVEIKTRIHCLWKRYYSMPRPAAFNESNYEQHFISSFLSNWFVPNSRPHAGNTFRNALKDASQISNSQRGEEKVAFYSCFESVIFGNRNQDAKLNIYSSFNSTWTGIEAKNAARCYNRRKCCWRKPTTWNALRSNPRCAKNRSQFCTQMRYLGFVDFQGICWDFEFRIVFRIAFYSAWWRLVSEVHAVRLSSFVWISRALVT